MSILDDFDPKLMLYDDGALAKLADERSAIMERMFVMPKPGTPAADLAPAEKMWVLRAFGVPMHCEIDGTTLRWVTSVPCGIADRGDGGYIVGMLRK